MANEQKIFCQKCGAEIGEIALIEGLEFLQTETLIIRHVGAICRKCRQPFAYAMSDRLLERIIRRKTEREKINTT